MSFNKNLTYYWMHLVYVWFSNFTKQCPYCMFNVIVCLRSCLLINWLLSWKFEDLNREVCFMIWKYQTNVKLLRSIGRMKCIIQKAFFSYHTISETQYCAHKYLLIRFSLIHCFLYLPPFIISMIDSIIF